MWKTWHNMVRASLSRQLLLPYCSNVHQLPEGTSSDIKQPQPEYSSLQRQQAVTWQAQKTYGALLNLADSLEQQLRLITVWKNMLEALGDAEALARMWELLVRDLGEEGPFLLGPYCA